MRLATILTSLFLVLGLAVMGCDSGSDDPSEDVGGEDECNPACEAGFTCIDGECVDDTTEECDPACEAGFTCVEATNTCAPDVVDPPDCETACANKECGDGGVADCNCGECDLELTCNETTGMCEIVCQTDCEGKQCSPDGCGGVCGICPCLGCPPDANICDEATGQCVAPEALTCAEINECQMACNPQDPSYETCVQNCKTEGSAEAQAQLNGLIQCLIDNGAQQCPPGDAQCQNDIIMEFCMTEFEACFPSGTLSCSEIFDCMAACPQGDQPCVQACYSDGTAEAKAQQQAVAACVIEQCGEQPTEECANAAQQGACAAVFADCFNLGKPGFATGPNGGSSADYVNMKMWLMGLDKDKLYNHH